MIYTLNSPRKPISYDLTKGRVPDSFYPTASRNSPLPHRRHASVDDRARTVDNIPLPQKNNKVQGHGGVQTRGMSGYDTQREKVRRVNLEDSRRPCVNGKHQRCNCLIGTEWSTAPGPGQTGVGGVAESGLSVAMFGTNS